MLVGSWAVLNLEALLIAEVNLHCHRLAASADDEADPDRVIPLAEMTLMTVGPVGEAAVTAVYLVMTFTLLLAYTSRAGELVDAGVQVSCFHTRGTSCRIECNVRRQ
jgi:amino acid permease